MAKKDVERLIVEINHVFDDFVALMPGSPPELHEAWRASLASSRDLLLVMARNCLPTPRVTQAEKPVNR